MDRAAGTDPTLTLHAEWTAWAYGQEAPPGQTMFNGQYVLDGALYGDPTVKYCDLHNVQENFGELTVQPGSWGFSLKESSPWDTGWVTWSRTFDWTEAGLATPGGEQPPDDSAGDRSWLEDQFKLSAATSEEWRAMVDSFKTCGPWGELARVAQPGAAAEPIGDLPAFALTLPRQRDATGVPVGPVIGSNPFQLLPLDYQFAGGTTGSIGDAFAPWGQAGTLGGWRTAVRTIINFACWGFLAVGFVAWLKGRVTV